MPSILLFCCTLTLLLHTIINKMPLYIYHVLSCMFMFMFSICAATTSVPILPSSRYGPDLDAARRNANHIFNTIHSAMKQWGSSVNHNGVSFFLTTVPEGNLFYHGRPSPGRPETFEWLAFEMEHAYGFAMSRMLPPEQPPPIKFSDVLSSEKEFNPEMGEPKIEQRRDLNSTEDLDFQHRLAHESDVKKPTPRPPPSRGYFQTYRASRPLKLIYIDGMGAAKGSWGTTDSQDLLLSGLDRNFPDGPNFGDIVYGRLLCSLAKEWGIDGWVRMESGFEIIYCDFASGGGLDFVSQHGTAFPSENEHSQWEMKTLVFEALRAASKRYAGFGNGRISVDWSSMVSAFAYDVNTTNPDSKRQDLPRLIGLTKGERETIRARLTEVVASRKHGGNAVVDWQNVANSIVDRFSDRLKYIAHGNLSADALWAEVSTLLNPFLNYPADLNSSTSSPTAVSLCTRHYLDAPRVKRASWTPEDTAIFVAVEAVSHNVCSSLFEIRSLLSSSQVSGPSTLLKSREIADALFKQLQWTTWKDCSPCARSGQFCFTPMFPAGSMEDYHSPNCKGLDDILELFKGCYWGLGVPNPSPMCAS